VLATRGDLAEVRLRDDAAEWKALVERLDAQRVLDIGAGLDALPEEGEFDLIVAPNDPFAGILEDGARAAALANARRLLARDGLLVIEGLYVPPQEDVVASAPEVWPASAGSKTAPSSGRCGARLGSTSTTSARTARPSASGHGTAVRPPCANRAPASRAVSMSATSTRGPIA